jgi:SprT-like family
MAEYYLDEDWNLVKVPATANDLCQWATIFQQKYFSDCNPNVTVAVNTNPKFMGAAAFDPTTMTIHISERVTPLESVAKVCLLHEMVHIKLFMENKDPDEKHARRFRAEIKRLMLAGAYDRLL